MALKASKVPVSQSPRLDLLKYAPARTHEGPRRNTYILTSALTTALQKLAELA